VGVVVFDSDVLIGFLSANDAHHEDAVAWMKKALEPDTRRLLCAVNYSEILIGAVKAGQQEHVQAMVTRFTIEIVAVDVALAERAAAVRARTDLKLPDAYALATAIHAQKRGWNDVHLASFDAAVLRAYESLHPLDSSS
jgi:predicted nucleic acid-binding protein